MKHSRAAFATVFVLTAVVGTTIVFAAEEDNDIAARREGTTPPKITAVLPPTVYEPYLGILGNISVKGTGFKPNQILNLGQWGSLTLAPGTASDLVLVNLAFDDSITPDWIPFSISQKVTSHLTTTSSPTRTVFAGKKNTLVVTPTGLVQFQEGQEAPNSRSNAWFFNSTDVGLVPNGNSVGMGGFDWAIDDKTGYVLRTHYGTCLDWSDANWAGGGMIPINTVLNIAAKDGVGCTTRSDGQLSCFNIINETDVRSTVLSIPVGQNPWAVAVTASLGGLYAVVYSLGDSTLWLVSIPPDLTAKGAALTIVGSVKLPMFPPSKMDPWVGGWQLAVFETGPMAGTAVVLAEGDQVLSFVDLSTMTHQEAGLKPFLGEFHYPLYPLRIALNESIGTTLVSAADPTIGVSRLVSVNPKTETLSFLRPTSRLLAVGLGIGAIAPTGMQQIYICQGVTCETHWYQPE